MSLTNPLPRETRVSPAYACDGITRSFVVPFWFLAAEDLVIRLTSPLGAVTVFRDGVGYTVSGAGETGGGSVILSAAPANLWTAKIYGRRLPSRLTSVYNGGVVNGAALDRDLDEKTATQQELRRDIDEALDGVDALGLALAAVDDDADRAEAARLGAEVAAANASAFAPQTFVVAADAAALRGATPTNSRVAYLRSTRRILEGATGLAAGAIPDDGLLGVRPTGGDGSAGWRDIGDRAAIWHENIAEAQGLTHPVGNFIRTAYRDQPWGGGGATYERAASASAGGFVDAGGVHWRLMEGPNGWDVAAVCPCLTNAGRFLETTAERTLAFADGAIVYVMNDPTAADRGVWKKSGAPGAGSWTKLRAFEDAQPLLQAFIEEKSSWVNLRQHKTHICYWFGAYTLIMPATGLKIRQYRTWLAGRGALIDGQGTGGGGGVGAGVSITHDGSVNAVLYTTLEGITVRRMVTSGWSSLNASYIHARECYGDENGINGFSLSVGVSNLLVDCGGVKNANAGYLEQASVIGGNAYNTLYTKLVRFQAAENTQFGMGFYESANAELYECRVEINGNYIAGRRGVTIESCNRVKIAGIYTELQPFDIYVTTAPRVFDGTPGRPLQGSSDIWIIDPNMGGEQIGGVTPTNIFVNNTNGVELRGGRAPAKVDFQSGGGNSNVSINDNPDIGQLLAAGVAGLRFDGVRSGIITITDAATFFSETLSPVEPTANYDLWFGPASAATGGVASDAYRIRLVDNRSQGGFRVHLIAAPGAGQSISFPYFLRSKF
jgi:hypothetical protein